MTLTQNEILQLAEKLAELRRDAPNSIELTRNAKGDYQWVIKAYFADGETPLPLLEKMDERLRQTYLKDETQRLAEAFQLGQEAGK